MIILQIEHLVPNFEGWKKAFENDPIDRKKSGVRRYKIFQRVDMPNYVVIDLEFDHLEDAENTLSALKTLWKGMDGKISSKSANQDSSTYRLQRDLSRCSGKYYLKLLYSSSVTLCNHSTTPFCVLVLMAIWVIAFSREAPCQCTTSGGILMTSPLLNQLYGFALLLVVANSIRNNKNLAAGMSVPVVPCTCFKSHVTHHAIEYAIIGYQGFHPNLTSKIICGCGLPFWKDDILIFGSTHIFLLTKEIIRNQMAMEL